MKLECGIKWGSWVQVVTKVGDSCMTRGPVGDSRRRRWWKEHGGGMVSNMQKIEKV